MKSREAWVFRRGSKWNVGWYEPDGRRRSKSFGDKKSDANKFKAKKTAELIQGISDGNAPADWDQFCEDYKSRVYGSRRPATVTQYDNALAHFKRICKPQTTSDITTANLDLYISKRRSEKGKTGGTVSTVTVNKELRCIRAAARVAHDWERLAKVPKFRWLDEIETEVTYITEEQFQAMYAKCDVVTRPQLENIRAADWWRALLVFLWFTGWRIGEVQKLCREDVDLSKGIAKTRAEHNKGKRTANTPLHPIVVDHLESLKGFTVEQFPWPHEDTAIYDQFRLIQDAAGVEKQCEKQHTHSDACRYFGFHALRKSFATYNAMELSAAELQATMRHQDGATTAKYINMAKAVNRESVVDRLRVPNLKIGGAS